MNFVPEKLHTVGLDAQKSPLSHARMNAPSRLRARVCTCSGVLRANLSSLSPPFPPPFLFFLLFCVHDYLSVRLWVC